MKTIYRTNNRWSIFLAALLSLLSLSGLSLYFFNASIAFPPFTNTGLLFSSAGKWRLATTAENNAAGQAVPYSGASAQNLQPSSVMTGVEKASLAVTHGLRTFQNVLTFSIDYPFYISKVARHL